MVMSPMTTVMMFVDLFLAGFFCLFATLFNDFDIVVKYGCDDWYHVGFDHSGSYVFSSSDADVNYTLKCKIPFPHAHHVRTPTLLQYADETFDASIDG